jgi:type II secretory pathway pseudopilin PulG
MFIRRPTTIRNRQRGDTIVEVLIAVTVVSMVLGGAYVTTNKSLLATRAAQEQSGALKLTESQIEQLKGLAITNPSVIFSTVAAFCVYNQTQTPPSSDAKCTQDAAGVQVTADPKYDIAITRNNNDFMVKTTWTDVSGKRIDQLSLKYRIYQ